MPLLPPTYHPHLWFCSLPGRNRARCTSAAPLYFQPESHSGYECRDGGLKHNNPVELGVNECKQIWHPDVGFDVILSIGSGRAQKPQPKPASWKLIPDWLADLFNTLMSTMDGEEAWERFLQNQEPRTTSKASRLNVEFASTEAPALDDTSQVDSMEDLARTFEFREPRVGADESFTPILGRCESTLLDQLADRLRASMYFFQLESIRKLEDIYSVTGWIGCQIEPVDRAYSTLLQHTKSFQVKEKPYYLPINWHTMAGPGLRIPIEFNQQNVDAAIRIDVSFGAAHSVSISGFPLPLRVSVLWLSPARLSRCVFLPPRSQN